MRTKEMKYKGFEKIVFRNGLLMLKLIHVIRYCYALSKNKVVLSEHGKSSSPTFDEALH